MFTSGTSATTGGSTADFDAGFTVAAAASLTVRGDITLTISLLCLALGELNLVGGLKRAMAKCGYTDLKSFQKVELAVRY